MNTDFGGDMEHPKEGIASVGADGGAAERLRTVRGVGVAASVLVLLVVAYDVLHTVSDWRVYLVVEDILAGNATVADVQSVDDFAGYFDGLQGLAVLVPAGVVFLIWLWRARLNAEALGGPGSQRRARGWVVGSWMTPVANLWIPYRVVADVWEASAPRRTAPGPLLTVWWVAWVVGGMVNRAYTYQVMKDAASEDDLRRVVYLGTVGVALDVLAGVLIVHTVHRISVWQTQRLAGAGR